jgi:peptide/nickel transport system substrate-binding protein
LGGDSATSSGTERGKITVLAPWGFDPGNPRDLPDLLFDTPYGYRDGEFGQPKLVTGEERLDDGPTFRYRLRPGVRWHDGVPFTTRDIEFTRRFKQHPDIALDDGASETLTVLDDSTFTITYHRGREGPLNWEVYYPAHLLADLDPADWQRWEYWREPVGYGPYRFVRRSQEYFELEANPDYYLGKPRIDRVVYKLGGNPLTELKSGSVDLAIVDNNHQAELLAQDPRFKTYWYVSTKLHHLYWNHRHPILGDVRVRRALSLAIDRLELLEALDSPGWDESAGDLKAKIWTRPWDVWATDSQIERGETPDPLPHDPDGARRLLAEAGWEDEDGDGFREREGEPLEFYLLTNPGRESLAVLLQAQFQAVGARVIIDMKDNSVMLEQFQSGEFDAALASANGDLAGRALTGRGTESGVSYTGYSNPEFNRVLWESTWTVEEAEEGLRAIWPIFRADVPATLLTPQFANRTIAHRRVKGLESPMWAPLARIPWLWIEEEDVPREGEPEQSEPVSDQAAAQQGGSP